MSENRVHPGEFLVHMLEKGQWSYDKLWEKEPSDLVEYFHTALRLKRRRAATTLAVTIMHHPGMMPVHLFAVIASMGEINRRRIMYEAKLLSSRHA